LLGSIIYKGTFNNIILYGYDTIGMSSGASISFDISVTVDDIGGDLT